GCREIGGAEDFGREMDRFLSDSEALKRAGKAAGDYIRDNAGAADRIYDFVYG
ncbi:MAG TPA: 3-deoxy-D-manno-octulosonic acid transferase, partial [Alloprevotella sp.]|nr:3-deoxy-D-manno-octulosonic acid transferase [Alloprevotella sp.]